MPNAEKILGNIKGLRDHLQADEKPLLTIPGIWDSVSRGESDRRATTCEIILTNQRLLGYIYIKFPRERLFLDDFSLASITILSFRQKSFDPLFRELLVSDGLHKAYLRSSREKIELLYQELQAAIKTYAPHVTSSAEEAVASLAPVYERKEVRSTFEQSSLGIAVLFVGGLLLEIIGIMAWSITKSGQVGLPLCMAGFIAVLVATLTRRQRG